MTTIATPTRIRAVRRRHVCALCQHAIEPGMPAVSGVERTDGGPRRWHWHVECDRQAVVHGWRWDENGELAWGDGDALDAWLALCWAVALHGRACACGRRYRGNCPDDAACRFWKAREAGRAA